MKLNAPFEMQQAHIHRYNHTLNFNHGSPLGNPSPTENVQMHCSCILIIEAHVLQRTEPRALE